MEQNRFTYTSSKGLEKLSEKDIIDSIPVKKAKDDKIKKANTNVNYADGIVETIDGKILLLKRNKNSEMFPDLWCLPGGHIDEGETPKEACIREVKEETGLEVYSAKELFILPLKNGENIYYFHCLVSNINEISLINEEHTNYQFFDIEDLKEEELIPGLLKTLEDIFMTETKIIENMEKIEKAIESNDFQEETAELKKAVKKDIVIKNKIVKRRKGKPYWLKIYTHPNQTKSNPFTLRPVNNEITVGDRKISAHQFVKENIDKIDYTTGLDPRDGKKFNHYMTGEQYNLPEKKEKKGNPLPLGSYDILEIYLKPEVMEHVFDEETGEHLYSLLNDQKCNKSTGIRHEERFPKMGYNIKNNIIKINNKDE